MLTLDETVRAIKSLDTPKDVIETACQRVLWADSGDDDKLLTAKTLCLELSARYRDRIPMYHGIGIVAQTLGMLAGIYSKIGAKDEAVDKILEIVVASFEQTISIRLERIARTDPKQLLDILLGEAREARKRAMKREAETED